MPRKFNSKFRFRKPAEHAISTSAAKAAPAQVDMWYENIEEALRLKSEEDQDGYLFMANTFREQINAAYKAYSDAINNAVAWVVAGAPWVIPPKPADMITQHYNQLIGPIQAYDALLVAAGAAIALYDESDVDNYKFPGPLEGEFNDTIFSILLAYAHSGFTGLGDLTQTISFKVNQMPYTREHFVILSDLNECLPTTITPMKLGRSHANMLSRALKDQDIMTDWGKRHAVPQQLNHLSIACWDYVTDKDLINDNYIITMRQVSAVALREQANINYLDPGAPVENATETQEVITARTLANNQQNAEGRQRRHYANMSLAGFTFPPRTPPTGGSSS